MDVTHRVLGDGGAVTILPTGRRHRDLVARLLAELGPDGRRLRFLQAVPPTAEWAIAALCRTDDPVHVGRIAIDPEGAPIGVAQLFAVSQEPATAELAVAVAPSYQRRGAARLLVHELADLARARHIEWMSFTACPENRAAVGLMRAVGAAPRFANGLTHGRVPVDSIPTGVDGRTIRASSVPPFQVPKEKGVPC